MSTAVSKINDISMDMGKRLKKDDKPSPFMYMTIVSGHFYNSFISIVEGTQPEGFPFTAKEKFLRNLNGLSKPTIEKLIKYLLMEYFSFVENAMIKEFRDSFPMNYEDFKNQFIQEFRLTTKEKNEFEKILKDYDSGYHSRLLLSTMKFPKDRDDLFLVQTLEELKPVIFHQMNKKIFMLLNLDRRK